ncbi:MAG: hypothetical protein SV186_00630 [Candidatus Nanohaloarchaea archaeon]|nr:hypothetical protein [Candidatus Nanohaloarchaea archaeon]
MEYYDKILLGIPACLTAGALMGAVTSLSLSQTLMSGSLMAAGLMYQGMFANAPVGGKLLQEQSGSLPG